MASHYEERSDRSESNESPVKKVDDKQKNEQTKVNPEEVVETEKRQWGDGGVSCDIAR